MSAELSRNTFGTSLALTQGVRVWVRSRYIPEQSSPREKRYVFAYTVRITNESSSAVQLRSRHWVIRHADGKVEEVQGPGVVGQQPVLKPSQSFEYTSGCVLTSQRGSMEGTYQMEGADGEKFDAAIARFELHLPSTLN